MALPNINPTDLWSLAVDKINAAFNEVIESISRTKKVLKLAKHNGGFSATIDLAAQPPAVIDGVTLSQDNTDQRLISNTAGNAHLDDDDVVVSAGSVGLSNGHVSNDRIDLLYLNTVGILKVQGGTPAAVPVPPALPTGGVLLALAYVEAGATDTVNNIYLQPVYPNGTGIYIKEDGTTINIGGGGPLPLPPEKADQAETDGGVNDDKFITPAKYAVSTTKTASQSATDTGTNDVLYITPLKLKNYSGFPALSNDYVEKWDTVTLSQNNSWHTVAAGVGNDKIILVEMFVSSGPTRFVGVRAVGSALDRRRDVANDTSVTMIVETDGSGDIEAYSSSFNNTDFKVISILG